MAEVAALMLLLTSARSGRVAIEELLLAKWITSAFVRGMLFKVELSKIQSMLPRSTKELQGFCCKQRQNGGDE